MKHVRRTLLACTATLACTAASCSGGGSDGAPAPVRPATKSTCAEAVVGTTDTEMELVDRRLVPFGPTVLGVEAEYRSDTAHLLVASGGHLDDVVEAYDDLAPDGIVEVAGFRAGLLTGTHLADTVRLATWIDPEAAAPCDVHLVVARRMTETDFLAALDTIELRPASGAGTAAGASLRG